MKMISYIQLFLGISLCLFSLFTFSQTPPIAPTFAKVLQKHGDRRVDNYYWLKDVSDPKTIDYIKKENSYTEAIMKSTNTLQEKLYKEMLSRINQTDTTVPFFKNGYWYYIRYQKNKEFEILCRKKGDMNAPEEIILDLNKIVRKNNESIFDDFSVSPDNSKLAYLKDNTGEGTYNLYFRDISKNTDLPEIIERVSSFVWANDSKTILYSVTDSLGRSYKVLKHVLGTPINNDIVVFEEKDIQYDLYVEKSKSDKYIFINTGSEMLGENETWYIDADNPSTKPLIFNPRQKEHLYFVQHFGGDKFYVMTDKNAPNYRICETFIDKTEMKYWKEIIPHDPNALIWDFLCNDDFIIINEISKANSNIKIIDRKNNTKKTLDFGDEKDAYWYALLDFTTEKQDEIKIGYTSLITPVKIYNYNLYNQKLTLIKSEEVKKYDKNLYKTERLWVKSNDNVDIPVTIVYKKDLFNKGENPLLINVYGGYGVCNEPYFSSIYLSLLDRGFIYAKAHVRGGSEMGRNWYNDGKRLKKKNSIYDFITIAEYFIKENYTTKNKLFAEGHGIGGMILAAAMNIKPDLCKAIIFDTPNLDILTTLLETEANEVNQDFDELGNPNSEGYYEYIKSYSPYDNIAPKPYPSMLFLSSIDDRSVGFWEAAKFVAKIRINNNGDNPIILKTEFKRNDSGRYSSLDNFAFRYAFLFKLLGIKD